MLQEEDTDLLTGMKLISSAAECVCSLRKEDEFCMLWDTVTAKTADTPAIPEKRSQQLNKNLSVYVVEETTGVNSNDKTELCRLYFSALDHVLGEMETRFSERNSKVAAALAALDPEIAVMFGASTAMCENSFSGLKNVFTDHRRVMSHTRKSQLVHLAFERDLTKKFRHSLKDLVLQKFNSCRLQLFQK
ncbi:zinc finger MYM-type protein 1-like [Tachysurus ichikawai]